MLLDDLCKPSEGKDRFSRIKEWICSECEAEQNYDISVTRNILAFGRLIVGVTPPFRGDKEVKVAML